MSLVILLNAKRRIPVSVDVLGGGCAHIFNLNDISSNLYDMRAKIWALAGRGPMLQCLAPMPAAPDIGGHHPTMAGNIFFNPSLMTSTLKDASTNPISRVMTLMPVRPMKRAICGAME